MHLCSMIAFPPAKINLGLNVIAKREDGFHEIESIMIPVSIHDILEVVMDEDATANSVEYTRSGLHMDSDPERDLVMLAHKAFCERRNLPGLKVHLHKVIPMGAGMGGGSSDCASMLHLLNDLASEPLTSTDLHEIAMSLGSDIAFFLNAGAQLVTGRGEFLEPIDIDLKGVHGVIVNPGIHIPTGEAYANVELSGKRAGFKSAVKQPLEKWNDRLFNSMEAYAFKTHPVLSDIKASLLAAGAHLALMSGSGSTMYGLFNKQPGKLEWPEGYSSWTFSF